ncbi:MAG: tetratricopeptide repeat protein [Pseudomonadota bacterium]
MALVLCCFLLVSCTKSENKKSAEALTPPENIRQEVVASGVRLTWEQVPGALQYTVFWGTERHNYKQLLHTVQNSAVIKGLQPGALYAFAVTTWSPTGESEYSSESVLVYDNEPCRASTHLATGQSLLRQGSFEDAVAYLSASILLDPRSAEAYRMRGLANEKMNRSEQARKDYAMAEKLFNGRPLSLGPSTH